MTTTQGASQKSQQYFYTDPLAAAWMAKHFGMKFEEGTHGLVAKIICDNGQLNIEHGIGAWAMPWYIHPESLHLLEPQVGDWYGTDRSIGKILKPAIGHSCNSQMYGGNPRIIQRNGLAFMWPEQETE